MEVMIYKLLLGLVAMGIAATWVIVNDTARNKQIRNPN